MRCLSPKTVGFKADGKTICWSKNKYSKQYAPFQIPCGKCIACRLEYARQWAVRCVHEAQMHEENCFITLTYSDDHLTSEKLIYSDFQKFMKRLRFAYPNHDIGMFVTGEYGDKTQRPHWHAIIFGWEPQDSKPKYTSDRGDQVYSSETLEKLWGKGIAEFGSVTFESAGYCARYAAKKLKNLSDQSDKQPISKKSSKNAIGKRWLEKYWSDVFTHGKCMFQKSDGTVVTTGIPRYYEKWFKKNHPEKWIEYVTTTKAQIVKSAIEKEAKISLEEKKENFKNAALKGIEMLPVRTKKESQKIILDQKFEKLQKHLKL